LLTSIVRKSDATDGNSRSVNIFYDNAQNIYGRGTPTWSELGLDMRGRSTVLKESFRSTKPVTEFALNVLYRLQPPEGSPDHKELVSRGLIERTARNGIEWWDVRFNQIDGPKPTFHQFNNLDQEFQAIGQYVRDLICKEGLQPADICLLYNGSNVPFHLNNHLVPVLDELGVELSVQTNKPFSRSSNMILATTSHSFKGYESEVVIIPAVDQFRANDRGILASNLYVAMTRAKSVLTLFAQRMSTAESKTIYRVIEECLDNLHARPEVDCEISPQDDLADLSNIIGTENRKWLIGLWSHYRVSQEPLLTTKGEVIAEPLFWFKTNDKIYACFGKQKPSQRVSQNLEDLGVSVLSIGQVIGGHVGL